MSNLSLFRLIVAICELVLFSLGEPELLRGHRGHWTSCSDDIRVLGLSVDVLAAVFAAAAASERLKTAMVRFWMVWCTAGGVVKPRKMRRMVLSRSERR